MALYIGASKVGFAGGGGFGGTAMRWALSAIHGYCFGYCIYVLAVKPTFIQTRGASAASAKFGDNTPLSSSTTTSNPVPAAAISIIGPAGDLTSQQSFADGTCCGRVPSTWNPPTLTSQQRMQPSWLLQDQGSCMACQDLVDPDTETDHLFLSLPVDPSVRFEGTVVEKSAVLASKQAPLMLVCRTRHNQLHGSLAHSPDTSPSRSHHQARRPGEQVQEKYLLKVGDDLRQDQLVIQLMTLCNCIWRNHLPGQDARLVQLPLFRVLAVTPTSGYVKFVPDSTSLTEVLHKPRTSVQMQGLERTAAHAGLHTWVGCTVGGDRELLGALCLWTSAVD
eukprot:s746_g6.t1